MAYPDVTEPMEPSQGAGGSRIHTSTAQKPTHGVPLWQPQQSQGKQDHKGDTDDPRSQRFNDLTYLGPPPLGS
jgi:hypothetical protein